MKTIADEIEDLRRMDVAVLVVRYRELFGKEPRVRNREHLWKRCAWRLQEQRLGGLSGAAKDRLDELIASIEIPKAEAERTVAGKLKKSRKPDEPPVGSVLTRIWRGTTIEVKVVEGGYEYEGVPYKSLSAVAFASTSCKWNGRLFFNLVERRRST